MTPPDDTNGYLLRAPATDLEWAAYHRIRRTSLFERYHPEVVYDPNHPDERTAGKHPLVLIKDGRVIGTIRIDDFDAERAAFRIVAIDRAHQGRGHGTALLRLAEDFARRLGRHTAVLHGNPPNVAFYLRNGYREAAWDDDISLGDSVDLVKDLRAGTRPALGVGS